MWSYTLKSAGLKTTQLGLFGNPALGKYWTEHMLCYFTQQVGLKVFTKHAGLFYLSDLLFKKYYSAGLKCTGKNTYRITRGNSNNQKMNIYY